MIYVLSASRRHTIQWAREQGLKLLEVKHVQNSGSLPGVLRAGKTRIVKLPSYAQRRDHWSIDAKLKSLLRRVDIEIEEWRQRDDEVGDHFQDPGDPVPGDSPVEDKAEITFLAPEDEKFDAGGLPSGAAEITNDTGEPEVVQPAPVDEDKPHLPEGVLEVSGDDDSVGGQVQFGGAIPLTAGQAPLPDPEAQAAVNADHDANSVGGPIEDEKPKRRARRNKQQIAYDEAFAAHEDNPSEAHRKWLVEATDALRKRDPKDPRLTEGTDDLDF